MVAAPDAERPPSGGVQPATRAINGVPLAIFRPGAEYTGAAGSGNVEALSHSLSLLNPYVLSVLANRNTAWVVVPDSADQAFPDDDIADLPVRGWPQGMTLGDAGGGYFHDQPWMTRRDPAQAVVVASSGRDSSHDVNLHETGHAWDNRGKALESQQPGFLAAYRADVPGMTTRAEADAEGDPADSDAYYLQGDSSGVNAGAQEAYAESFARFVMNEATLKDNWPNMFSYWQGQNRLYPLRADDDRGNSQ